MTPPFKLRLPDLDPKLMNKALAHGMAAIETKLGYPIQDWIRKVSHRPAGAIRVIHWISEGFLKAFGFQLEIHRVGELRLGFWRKKLSSSARRARLKATHARPRRLMVIPGFGDTSLSWITLLSFLGKGLKSRYDEVIWLDYPGYVGFLSHLKGFHSLKLLRESVSRAIETYAPETVIGHSLGGYMAASFALHAHRENTAKKKGYAGPEELILMDAPGVFQSEADQQALVERFQKATELGFRYVRQHIYRREPLFLKWCMHELDAFIQREEVKEFLASVAEEQDPFEGLEALKVKAWVIWGEADTLVPTSGLGVWMDRLAPSKPRGFLIKGVGHSPHVENPVATGKLLTAILMGERLDRPSAAGLWVEV